ncbi:MAG: hypothetical protein J7D61_07845 [Marichromatium sp.]|nr:hypothetical protein [Marichromatium sp.]
MDVILTNLDVILTVLLSLHGTAVLIVNLTPTPVDNTIVSAFYKVVEVLAGIVSPAAKQRPGERFG